MRRRMSVPVRLAVSHDVKERILQEQVSGDRINRRA